MMNSKLTRMSAGNGLTRFSIHSNDHESKPAIEALRAEEATHPEFAFAEAPSIDTVDPETVARRYLDQALGSASVPQFVAPVADNVPSEFKSLGSKMIPLTGTTTVKFRQNFSKIPVYGSLVTVELDESNNLLGIDSALGTPQAVSPIAKISADDALKAVEKHPGQVKDLKGIVPRINFYFDRAISKWRLVFILEDVPVVPDTKTKGHSPVLMDYIVDAHSGKVVTALARTPTLAVRESARDGLGKVRNFQIETTGTSKVLMNSTLNVQTFDFKFNDPVKQSQFLPGTPIEDPSDFPPSAVSAHANAEAVSIFMRKVLKRNNIDDLGGLMSSSINCVDMSDSPDGKQWVNAFWNGRQMVYGQRKKGTEVLSMSVALDIVGHEMFHGVTDMTSRLEYAFQPGALNESYSDIFGIIIKNQSTPDSRAWNWELGAGLRPNGKPFRDMSNPPLWGQPEEMKNFKVSLNTRSGDYGGVHINSGIHNKAAYHILTAVKGGALVFKPEDVAAIFYLALTQRLSRTSQFADSRTAVLNSARTLFRNLAPAALAEKILAIEAGFSKVGIN